MTSVRNILGDISRIRARGVRRAARKKVSRPPREPIATMVVIEAAKAMKRIFPQVKRLHLVGSRLRRKIGRDIDFVAVVKKKRDLPGRNIVDLSFGLLRINIFFSLPDEVETHIIEFGLGLDIIRWKNRAKDKGLKLNRFGLFRGPVKVSGSMEEIASILGLTLKPALLMSLKNPL